MDIIRKTKIYERYNRKRRKKIARWLWDWIINWIFKQAIIIEYIDGIIKNWPNYKYKKIMVCQKIYRWYKKNKSRKTSWNSNIDVSID